LRISAAAVGLIVLVFFKIIHLKADQFLLSNTFQNWQEKTRQKIDNIVDGIFFF
jgi:hypothetical protein